MRNLFLAAFLVFVCSSVYAGCPGGTCSNNRLKNEVVRSNNFYSSATVFIEGVPPVSGVKTVTNTKSRTRSTRRFR